MASTQHRENGPFREGERVSSDPWGQKLLLESVSPLDLNLLSEIKYAFFSFYLRKTPVQGCNAEKRGRTAEACGSATPESFRNIRSGLPGSLKRTPQPLFFGCGQKLTFASLISG